MTDTISDLDRPPPAVDEAGRPGGTGTATPRPATTWQLGCTCVDCDGPLHIVNQTPVSETFRGGHVANQAQSTILACECGTEHEFRAVLIRNKGKWL